MADRLDFFRVGPPPNILIFKHIPKTVEIGYHNRNNFKKFSKNSFWWEPLTSRISVAAQPTAPPNRCQSCNCNVFIHTLCPVDALLDAQTRTNRNQMAVASFLCIQGASTCAAGEISRWMHPECNSHVFPLQKE